MSYWHLLAWLSHIKFKPKQQQMSRRSISIAAKSSVNIKSKTNTNKFHQTKSEIMPDEPLENIRSPTWYLTKSQRPLSILPKYLPVNKNSQPFRLIIDKITGVSIPKKSSASQQYLNLSLNFVTDELDVIGGTVEYQCQYPIHNDKYDSTISNCKPICVYYHSRVDKNCPKFKLLIAFTLKQVNNGIVQASVRLGVAVLAKPLIEDEVKNFPIDREHSQMDLMTGIYPASVSSGITFSYEIESKIQLKNLIKFVSPETIVTPQQEVSGVLMSFLPEDKDDPIEEEGVIMIINVKSFQLQIPEKFENQVLSAIKSMRPNSSTATSSTLQIKSRRMLCGYHNQYQFVTPSSRALEFLGKQQTGQYNINVYEVLSEQEEMKLAYYVGEDEDDETGNQKCALAFSLLYEIVGESQPFEVSIFSIKPTFMGSEDGEQTVQISENMVTGPGRGLYSNLLQVNTKRAPAILLQYETSDAIMMNTRMEDDSKSVTYSRIKSKQSHLAIPMGSSKRAYTQNDIQYQSRALEEVERERLRLQQEKQELQILKTQQNFNFQEEFERRFEEEREQLRIRQAMLEQQYRDEVEKQIRMKVQLEQQITMMKERLALVEEGYKQGMPSKKISYDATPEPQEYGFPQGHPSTWTPPHPQSNIRQKVNPNYLLEQERTIPIAEVRELIAQTFAVDREAIERQYKMFNYASKITFVFSSIIWSPEVVAPKSFFMIVRFFHFRSFKTDTLSYVESESEYHRLIKLNSYSYSHEDATPIYTFTVDPSKYANPEILQEDFVDYLTRNNAILDLFDAENHIYIGQINIKLTELLRGPKSQVLVAKEYNIIRVKNQENYGVLQLLIKNEQADCQQEISLADKKRVRDIRKKVISNNPIALSSPEIQKVLMSFNKGESGSEQQIESLTKLTGSNSTKSRLESRILNYKKKAAENKAKNGLVPRFDDLEQRQKGKLINKIHAYKEKKMPEYIKKIYEELLTETITINPYFGQSTTFIYEFTNLSQSPSSFKISVQSARPDKSLTVVKNAAEWKHYVNKNSYPRPKIYECINDEDSFYLAAGESIPLCFKYISFSVASDNSRQDEASRDSVLNVTITKQENSWIIGGFTLKVEPHSSIINHSYILYQPGGHLIDLIMPVIYSSQDTSIPKRLFITTEQAEADWLSEYEILLRVKAPDIMNKMKFHMLLYEDQYCDKMRENWLIQLHAYEGVCAYSRAEEKTKFKICLPEQVMRAHPMMLKLHASHPDLIFDQEQISGSRLSKGGAIETWCQLMPNSSPYTEIQITCTDEQDELVYAWVVQVFAYTPKRA